MTNGSESNTLLPMAKRTNKASKIGTIDPHSEWMIPGARVHYFGDVCNHAKDGSIVRTWSDQWDNNIEIKWDDGSTSTVGTNSFRYSPLGSRPTFVRIHSYTISPERHRILEEFAEEQGLSLDDAIHAAIYYAARRKEIEARERTYKAAGVI